jgi:hypothetical protein
MDDYRVVVVHFRLRRACSAAGGNRLPTGAWQHLPVVRGAGVKAEVANEPDDDAIELVLQVFADLEGGRRVVAHPDDEPAQF